MYTGAGQILPQLLTMIHGVPVKCNHALQNHITVLLYDLNNVLKVTSNPIKQN